MREKLAEIEGTRDVFRGTFARYGEAFKIERIRIRTLLLLDVTDATGIVVADHLWFKERTRFRALAPLHEGDIVTFRGRAMRYHRRYHGKSANHPLNIDYRLSYPSRVACIGRAV